MSNKNKEVTKDELENLMSVEDVAKVIGVGKETIRRWIQRHENGGKDTDVFPYLEIHGRFYTTPTKLNGWLMQKMKDKGF